MTREQFISHVESSQRSFRRFLTALCGGDAALADDIAQESLMKAYLSCDGFRDAGKFNAWIYRIGYNTFLNHRRSQRDFAGLIELERMESQEETDGAFRYQALYEALNSLTDKERTSILLHYMEGYSVKEISEITEASQDAVKKHLSRGRIHLRELIVNI